MSSRQQGTTAGLFEAGHPLASGSDIVLISSDGKVFHVHRVLLSMWSVFFEELFQAMPDDTTITLTDTAADVLLMLGQIYPSPARTHLTANNVECVMDLADKYHISDLLVTCGKFITETAMPQLKASGGNSIDPVDQVLRWQCLAKRYDLPQLSQDCLALLGAKFFDWNVKRHMRKLTKLQPPLTADELMTVLEQIPAESTAGSSNNNATSSSSTLVQPSTGIRRIIPVVAVQEPWNAPFAPPAAAPLLHAP